MGDTTREDLLSERIRAEATGVKQCFTTFSFQALALAATVLAASLGAMARFPSAAYAPLAVIPLLMTVCRVGLFKYATANRNYGYELHLARTRNLHMPHAHGKSPLWKDEMRSIDWEEAVRAWRIVQSTIFREIYRTPETDRFARLLTRTHVLAGVNALRPDLYRLTPIARRVVTAFQNSTASYAPSSDEMDPYPWFMPAILAHGRKRRFRLSCG